MKFVVRRLFVFFFLFTSVSCFALAPAWKIDPTNSFITFAATQNGAPVKGNFKNFSGVIHFDPNDLAQSDVKIVVDTRSVHTAYDDLTATLITSDWFNIAEFPQAVFSAKSFKKLSGDNYSAEGNLTIKNKSVPVTLTFTFKQPEPNVANVKGSTTLKRLAFGIGEGEWSSTSEIKNQVVVNFTVVATKEG